MPAGFETRFLRKTSQVSCVFRRKLEALHDSAEHSALLHPNCWRLVEKPFVQYVTIFG